MRRGVSSTFASSHFTLSGTTFPQESHDDPHCGSLRRAVIVVPFAMSDQMRSLERQNDSSIDSTSSGGVVLLSGRFAYS